MALEEQEVVQAEHEAIAQRRDVAFPKSDGSPWRAEDVREDLVGLALSGGGIRSATFNLGLLQALHGNGLLRYVDYLSTVSGGSYIGAHFASLLLQLQQKNPAPDARPFEVFRDKLPLTNPPHAPQHWRILLFIRNGRYLNRPWEFVARYLVGLVLNLAVFASGIIAMAALLAFGWRLFDQPRLHDITHLDQAPGVLEGLWYSPSLEQMKMLLPAVACLLLKPVLQLAAVLVDRAFLRRKVLNPPATWFMSRLAVVGSLLAVILAVVDRNWLQDACDAAIAVSGCLLALGVLYLIGSYFLALPSPTEQNPLEYRTAAWLGVFFVAFYLNGRLAQQWLWNWLPETFKDYDSASQDFTPDWVRAFLPTILCWGFYWLVKGVLGAVNHFQPEDRQIVRPQRWMYAIAWLSALLSLTVLLSNGTVSLGVLQYLTPERWRVYNGDVGNHSSIQLLPLPLSLRIVLYGVLVVMALTLLVAMVMPARLLTSGQRPKRLAELRLFRFVVAVTLLGIPIAIFYWMARPNISGAAPYGQVLLVKTLEKPVRIDARFVPQEYSSRFDPDRSRIKLVFADKPDYLSPESLWDDFYFFQQWPWRGLHQESSEPQYSQMNGLVDARTLSLSPKDIQNQAPRSEPFWIELYYVKKVKADVFGKGFQDYPNRVTGLAVLDAPDARRLAKQNSNDSEEKPLIYLDQDKRIHYAAYAGAIFLILGSFVSFNYTSLHSFYRDRLTEAYIEPVPPFGSAIPMSEVHTVPVGGPYQLISGTLNLIGDRLSPERTEHFLFSSKYCGSRTTKYYETKKFLDHGFDNLGDVIAISGAAASPAPVQSLIVAAMMTLANIRLGQWIAHPGRWLPAVLWPSAISLGMDYFRFAERRRRFFISDGGHDENLGLAPLMRRRCKLILVSDASQDAEHAFEDFLKFCRRARLQEGVQFLDLYDDTKPIALKPVQLKADSTTTHHYFIGRIRYAATPSGGPSEGFIIYLKPSLTMDEEHDLLKHFKYRRPFPHDKTLDQMYDEDTVESYRQLGAHIGDILGRELPPAKAMWNETQRFDVVNQLFWPGLVRGLPDEAAAQWHAAQEWLRHCETDAELQQATAARVRLFLEQQHAANSEDPAPSFSLRDRATGQEQAWRDMVLLLAVACNGRWTAHPGNESLPWQQRGRKRLLHLAIRHGRRLALLLNRQQWEQFLLSVCSLALAMREGVFVGRGRETATDMVLCLLRLAGFQPRPGRDDRAALTDLIAEGHTQPLVELLKKSHEIPR